jgi:hypothetical protein
MTLDFARNARGQFEGTAEVDTSEKVTFCGTLELLKVLEEASSTLDPGHPVEG